jgi:hypothetical protein
MLMANYLKKKYLSSINMWSRRLEEQSLELFNNELLKNNTEV